MTVSAVVGVFIPVIVLGVTELSVTGLEPAAVSLAAF